MLHINQILSLRDFALEHLPKVRALRELNARCGKHAAEETVAGASRTFLLDPLAIASERQALRLLDFIHQHPQTHWTTYYLKELLDGNVIEEQKRELEQALENQPLCEQRILEEARLLNGLSGVPLPPWVAQSNMPAPTIEPGTTATALQEQTSNAGLPKREKQIRAIEAAATAQGYDALSIPTKGKTILRAQCQKSNPVLFGAGPHPFNDAWKVANACKPPRLRMAEYRKFTGK